MPPALGDSSGMGVRVSRGLLKLEVQVETWWMWRGVSGGPLTVAFVSLQEGLRCLLWPQGYPPSSGSHTWRCALERQGSWCWCVPTSLPRGSQPMSSYTAWRYSTAQLPRPPSVPLLELRCALAPSSLLSSFSPFSPCEPWGLHHDSPLLGSAFMLGHAAPSAP